MLPVLTFKKVFHVGTLNKADKGNQGLSYEGKGLSVSQCPASWVQIAQLGGLPWHELTKTGNQFLDFHKIKTGKYWKFLEAWALQKSFVKPCDIYSVEWYDDELDAVASMSFTSKEAAEAEMDDGRELKAKADITLMPDLATLVGLTTDPIHTKDAVAIAYAMELKLDGVWWKDINRPQTLSAPRGVILPDRLSEWSSSMI